MSAVPAAARRTDLIELNESQFVRFLGFLVWVRYGSRVVKAILAFAGPAGWTAIAVGFVVEWAISTAFDAALEKIGEMIKYTGVPEIEEGSKNVWINSLEAARGGPEGDKCRVGVKVREGSEWVYFNTKPAARIGDKVEASGTLALKTGSVANVFIGGPPVEFDNKLGIHSLLEDLVTFKELGSSRSLRELAIGTRTEFGGIGKEFATEVADALWAAARPN